MTPLTFIRNLFIMYLSNIIFVDWPPAENNHESKILKNTRDNSYTYSGFWEIRALHDFKIHHVTYIW